MPPTTLNRPLPSSSNPGDFVLILSKQVLFYSWLGAVLVLLGTSIKASSKEWGRHDLYTGSFFLGLGLFFLTFAVWVGGCQDCSGTCTRPTFRLMDGLALIGALLIFGSTLLMLQQQQQGQSNSTKLQEQHGLALFLFVFGWVLLAIAMASHKKMDVRKVVTAVMGVALLLGGQVFLIVQRQDKVVDGPGLILSSVGLIMLVFTNASVSNPF